MRSSHSCLLLLEWEGRRVVCGSLLQQLQHPQEQLQQLLVMGCNRALVLTYSLLLHLLLLLLLGRCNRGQALAPQGSRMCDRALVVACSLLVPMRLLLLGWGDPLVLLLNNLGLVRWLGEWQGRGLSTACWSGACPIHVDVHVGVC
jgi:hypothetical protein